MFLFSYPINLVEIMLLDFIFHNFRIPKINAFKS